LGFKSEQELVSEVKLPLNPGDITQISCGGRHAVILSKNGEVFITGKNDLNYNSCQFTKYESGLKFTLISCGWDVSAGITNDKKLYVWGCNTSISNGAIVKEPQKLTLPEDQTPEDIKFGLKHSAILTESNEILITGSLRHFKKHTSRYATVHHNSVEWLRVTSSDIITHFSAGQNFITFAIHHHIVNGIGDDKFSQCERTIACDKIVKLESGWTHNAYLTESKELFLYGRNNYGQLGNGHKGGAVASPQKCPIHPVEQFSIGSEHCVLSSGDDIYAFGWNEHYSTGQNVDDDV
jgi:secretion-regulating guanine nucleotide exchange factor